MKSVHNLSGALQGPISHYVQVFLTKEDVLFIPEQVLLRGRFCALKVNGLLPNIPEDEAWKFTGEQLQSAWSVVFFEKCSARILGRTYTVMENFATDKIRIGVFFDKYELDRYSQQKDCSNDVPF